MALEPKEKTKKAVKKPAAKAKPAKKPTATKAKTTKKPTTKAKTSKAKTKTAKPKASVAKKASVKTTKAKPTTANKETIEKKAEQKKEPPMSANTQTQENAKLEQSGSMADKVWRLIAMCAFALIGNFALVAIIVLSAMQFVVVFMEDKPNKEVQALIDKLAGYLTNIFDFLSYRSDIMPFPFSSFPKSKEE